MIHVIPTTTTVTARGMANLYKEHVFAKHGIPRKFIHDRGTQFQSSFMTSLYQILGIEGNPSTAYHPQTDGQTERMNQEIETYLRIYCSNHPENWADQVPLMEFAHNVNVHSATKTSPFRLLYGFDPVALPDDLDIKSNIPSISKRLKDLVHQRQEAMAALELS